MKNRKFRVLDDAGVMLNGKRHAKDSSIEGDLGDARLKTYLYFKQIEEIEQVEETTAGTGAAKKSSK